LASDPSDAHFGGKPSPIRIRIKHGCDVPIGGAPEQSIEKGAAIRTLAMSGTEFIGPRPQLRVRVGDVVSLGDPLFVDKHDPAVAFTAPGSGTVADIVRGHRRALESIVIRLDGKDCGATDRVAGLGSPGARMERTKVVEQLCRTGLWAAIRARPFNRVPHSSSTPSAIFVTAIDTQPLAADPQVVIRPRLAAFEKGLQVLATLTDGPLWLCTAPGWALGTPRMAGLRQAEFAGPHPAGLAGTHIHRLHPVRDNRVAWHVGYQDVIAIGRLFANGVLDFRRVVALGGEPVQRPRLLRTRLGASLEDLVHLETGDSRPYSILSGSPLGGHRSHAQSAFLGRFHLQVSLLPVPSRTRPFAWWWRGRKPRSAADARGSPTGMLPLERFERLMQPGFLAVPLLRALLAGDTVRARELGCLELDEEDLALCAWACPARSDYMGALRDALTRIAREG